MNWLSVPKLTRRYSRIILPVMLVPELPCPTIITGESSRWLTKGGGQSAEGWFINGPRQGCRSGGNRSNHSVLSKIAAPGRSGVKEALRNGQALSVEAGETPRQ